MVGGLFKPLRTAGTMPKLTFQHGQSIDDAFGPHLALVDYRTVATAATAGQPADGFCAFLGFIPVDFSHIYVDFKGPECSCLITMISQHKPL